MSITKCLWGDLLKSFEVGMENAIIKLGELDKDIDNLETIRDPNPNNDALALLLKELNRMKDEFPTNNGEIFKLTIDKAIQKNIFPQTNNIADAFDDILKSRTHEQDFILNELINGFIASKDKAIASNLKGTIIDKMVEAFSTRKDFRIVDHQFYAMFGDPNNPRTNIEEELKDLIQIFGLVAEDLVVEKDIRRSERKVYTFYTFPVQILDILKKKYLVTNPVNGNLSVSKEFDRSVLICLFLANISVNRDKFDQIGGEYTVNGISAIFSLMLVLSFMPSVPVPAKIRDNPVYKKSKLPMSVIPRSWMVQQVIEFIFEPLIKVIAYRVGGIPWCEAIIDTEINKQIHTQIRFLIKDVNKWIVGELVRVDIPLFQDILNQIQITIQTRQTQAKDSP